MLGWLMAHGFLPVDRDQAFWVSTSYRELVDEDHPVLAVIDAVEGFDLSAFMPAKRADGKGRAGYHPAMMVALLLWAYANGVYSSRQIERRCRQDAPFRVICAGHEPDHATIARFRAEHEDAVKDLHVQVLALCAAAGLVQVGLMALDSTKISGAGSSKANRRYEKIIEAIEAMHAAAAAADAAEEQGGAGAQSPRRRSGRAQRLARFQEAKAQVETEAAAAYTEWKQRQDKRQAAAARGKPGRPRTKPDPPPQPQGRRVNTTDPDSRRLFGKKGYVQGYSAHAIATAGYQIVVTTEVTNEQNDAPWLHHMLEKGRKVLIRAGVTTPIGAVAADNGYYSDDNVKDCTQPDLLIPPVAGDKLDAQLAAADPDAHDSTAPSADTKAARREQMIRKLADPANREAYAKRQHTIEPVFGDLKHNLGFTRFFRRGLAACDAEFTLLAAARNLAKWIRHRNTQDHADRLPDVLVGLHGMLHAVDEHHAVGSNDQQDPPDTGATPPQPTTTRRRPPPSLVPRLCAHAPGTHRARQRRTATA
jgi:transposase